MTKLLSFVITLTMIRGLDGASRLKELATLEGVRDNQLIGYGLVVGLAGTGDKKQTVFSAQSVTNMLERMGINVSPTALQVKNVAAVIVTATLPPYAQPGTRIDLTASTLGDATNLQGGQLLMTALRAADGQTYAVAQGAVITGGFVAGRSGNSQTVNHPTAGRVPNGAIVERTAPTASTTSRIRWQLRQADFTTAARIAEAINKKFSRDGTLVARAESSATVAVETPPLFLAKPVEFIAEMESIPIEADRKAKVVINERTGTIILGKDVTISPTAILHGNLSVEVQTQYNVSQPNPLGAGQTTVTPETTLAVKEEKAKNIVLRQGATVEELVRALKAIGSTPRDIIAILQNLKAAGALDAELEAI